MSGEPAMPVGDLLQEYFPQGNGVVHANVGQKLLNYYPLRVFSGDQ
jgi:hypothetical protein